MEDAHILQANFQTEEISLFCIFDGHGGSEIAAYAAENFPNHLKVEYLLGEQPENHIKQAILKLDEQMKKPDIQERCIKNPNAGCTALIALIIKGVLYIANVGDSRAILCNKSVAYDLSKDHKPDDPKEKARIESLGGMINAGRVNGSLNLSRALGDFEFKNIERNSQENQLIIPVPEIRKKKLTKADQFILMGCDGVFEKLNHQELVDFVQKKLQALPDKEDPSLNPICAELLDTLLAPDPQCAYGLDNMSLILIVLKQNQ